MKAIFMTEFGGKLMEVERREIPPSPDYYVAVRSPIQVRAFVGEEIPQALEAKREHWVCRSTPRTPDDFAVFLLKEIT